MLGLRWVVWIGSFDYSSHYYARIAAVLRTMALSRYEWVSGGWPLDRRTRIALVQAAWMTVVLGALVALDRFSAESYFVLSFLGLLAVLQIFAPPTDEIEEATVIRWIKLAGFLVFGYIILGRIVAVV